MKKIVLLSFALLTVFQATAGGDDNLSAVIEGLQKEYKDIPGLTINYSREVITRSMAMLGDKAKGDLASGVIYFKPPRFLKLEQKSPQVEILLVNGDTLWWYLPDKKTAYRYPSKDFGKEMELLSDIFSGFTGIEEKFKVEIVPGEDPDKHLVLLRPLPQWQDIDHILLELTSLYKIKGIDIHNQLGGITRFRLEETVRTEFFKDGFFEFTVPEGVEVKEGMDQ